MAYTRARIASCDCVKAITEKGGFPFRPYSQGHNFIRTKASSSPYIICNLLYHSVNDSRTDNLTLCSTICWGLHQRKHQIPRCWHLVRGNYPWPVVSPDKLQVKQKAFPCHGASYGESIASAPEDINRAITTPQFICFHVILVVLCDMKNGLHATDNLPLACLLDMIWIRCIKPFFIELKKKNSIDAPRITLL